MALPAFAPIPTPQSRRDLPSKEWKECLQGWLSLTQTCLNLPQQIFELEIDRNSSLLWFIKSFVEQTATQEGDLSSDTFGSPLRQHIFFLTHRILTTVSSPPAALLDFSFLGDLCTVYTKTGALRNLMDSTWVRHGLDSRPEMLKSKTSLMTELEGVGSKSSGTLDTIVRRSGAFIKASNYYGRFLMAGADLLDALASSWRRGGPDHKKKLATIAYFAFTSLIKGISPNVSLLVDQLYSLKSDVEAYKSPGSILVDLVSNTPFLAKLQHATHASESGRAKTILLYLRGLSSTPYRPKKFVRRKIDKGKDVDSSRYGHGTFGGIHVHTLSKITQIQDLFPDLGSAYIVKLLDAFNDNAEQATAHLLDDSLPAHLSSADKTEKMQETIEDSEELTRNLVPRFTPHMTSTRHNAFDNDEFDNLSISTKNLHIGRRDKISEVTTTAPNKASILAALATFDADDDERDDTYDIEDVGGTVDTARSDVDELNADLRDHNDEALFAAWKLSPTTFARDAETRRSSARASLRSEIGMADEGIEGWAIMLGRDPGKIRRLEAKFSTFSGAQSELISTSWKDGDGSGGEGEDRGAYSSLRERGRGRGRGRNFGDRGRGRGGDVSGSLDDKARQIARQRKDVNKGSRANHNRRDQRARKVARGGFPG